MKKLYSLKTWFSLADAAERLGAGLGEPVTVNDMLQLVIENHLPLSWYARHVPAQKVAPYTALYGRGYRPGFNELFPDVHEDGEDLLRAINWWKPLDGDDAIVYLDGPFRLELEHCGALKDWIHSHITHTGGELITLVGFIVSEPDGTLWQIMERTPGGVYRSPDGREKEYKPIWHPCGTFPQEADLIIQQQDIELFEKSLIEPSTTGATDLPQRTETSYLNIIAALLEVISHGIPSSDVPSGKIGPADSFKSEAKLIEALDAHFKGYGGLSKSNLARKFPEAKRALQPR